MPCAQMRRCLTIGKLPNVIHMRNNLNLFVSVVLYIFPIASFLVAQLPVVSDTVLNGSVYSYNYPLRIAVNCFAISQDNINADS